VAQGVQWPLEADPGQLSGLAQLPADVLAVHGLVAPAAGEDRLLRPPCEASGTGVGEDRLLDQWRQARCSSLLNALQSQRSHVTLAAWAGQDGPGSWPASKVISA
jgi:hypothetical protein